MRRWLLAVLLASAALNVVGCQPQVNPDPAPTGFGPKRYRPVPEGAADGAESKGDAEEDAQASKSSHPLA